MGMLEKKIKAEEASEVNNDCDNRDLIRSAYTKGTRHEDIDR